MKISRINSSGVYGQTHKQIAPKDPVSFGIYVRGEESASRKFQHKYTSWFFRDLATLDIAVNYLEKTFPKGTTILDYACSNGQEALSLNMMFKDRNKYLIQCYDTDEKSIEDAKRGEYNVATEIFGEEFLLYNNDATGKQQKELANKFEQFFDKSGDIFDHHLSTKKFKVKDSLKDNINFEQGDIKNVDSAACGQKVGAIFFRNAFYHMLERAETMGYKCTGEGKTKIKDVIDKAYTRLEPGGIFVMGNCLEDSIFRANSAAVPESHLATTVLRDCRVSILKKTPIQEMLEGRGFTPIGYSTVNDDFAVPTVWKKPFKGEIKKTAPLKNKAAV